MSAQLPGKNDSCDIPRIFGKRMAARRLAVHRQPVPSLATTALHEIEVALAAFMRLVSASAQPG
jgi:hypothetical protein